MVRFILLQCVLFPIQLLSQLQYPHTKKVDTIDNYHGTMVADPYRWLEDDNSNETKAWVEAQNKVTNGYLEKIPFREKVKKRLTEMWNYPKFSAPFRKGEFYYFAKNDGLQNQFVWYRQKGLNGKPEIFFDPNKLSPDGTVSLGNFEFSRRGKYMAMTIQKSGSDWQQAFIMDVTKKTILRDTLNWLKFTDLSWQGDEGFYYSRFPEPGAGNELKELNIGPKVYYHKVGALQSADELVYEDIVHPDWFPGVFLTEDERFLILQITTGTSGAEIWVKDRKNAAQKNFSLLIPGFATEASVINNTGDQLLVRTNEGSPDYRLVMIDPLRPAKENWKDIIPEKIDYLENVASGGGYLFASYLKDASTRVYQYDYAGKPVREIKLPGIGTAGGFGTEKKYGDFFYFYSSFNYPPSVFRYDIKTGRSTLYKRSEVRFNPAGYEVKQVFAPGKDGTKVPVFLTFKKGLKQDGQNPVLMYGYGGFNVPMTPYFSITNVFFLEQGGIYAQVCLRGGSEYGELWHKAGMLDKKQNVFDDFISAAEWLIKNKYSNSNRLAIEGGSNGGLLVGACMTQRPDLFKVAIPEVGVMDMLRYHKFTIGYAWATEYGRSDSAGQFNYLYKYSPLHNLKKGVNYPATLVMTADHDDRVVPAHSFKFGAALQEDIAGNNPALIRIETKAGHGGGMPTSKQIEEVADIWSFVMYNLNMPFRENAALPVKQEKKAF